MTVQQVRYFGDPVLNSRADEVQSIDSTTHKLVEDMLDSMDHYGGVGLAANQIGVLKRVFVYDCDGQRGHIINPVWEALSEETVHEPEGCLSIPDVQKEVERAEQVKVTGQTLDGSDVEIISDGLLSRCIQHETDHLDGVLFLKRLTPELRKEAMKEIRTSQWFNAS